MGLAEALLRAYGTAVVMAAREIEPDCPDFMTALKILPRKKFEALRSSYAAQIDELHRQAIRPEEGTSKALGDAGEGGAPDV